MVYPLGGNFTKQPFWLIYYLVSNWALRSLVDQRNTFSKERLVASGVKTILEITTNYCKSNIHQFPCSCTLRNVEGSRDSQVDIVILNRKKGENPQPHEISGGIAMESAERSSGIKRVSFLC